MFVLNSLGYVRLSAPKHPVLFNVCGNDSAPSYYSRQAAYTSIAYRRIKSNDNNQRSEANRPNEGLRINEQTTKENWF